MVVYLSIICEETLYNNCGFKGDSGGKWDCVPRRFHLHRSKSKKLLEFSCFLLLSFLFFKSNSQTSVNFSLLRTAAKMD